MLFNILGAYLLFSFIPCGIIHILMRNPPIEKASDLLKRTFLPYVLYLLFTNPAKLKNHD